MQTDPQPVTIEENVRNIEKRMSAARDLEEVEVVDNDDNVHDGAPYLCYNHDKTGFFGINGEEYFFAELTGHKYGEDDDQEIIYDY